MTTLYLFDEDQTLIHAIPSKDMIQARQTLEKPDDGELPIDQFTAIYKLEAYKDYESIHYMAVKDLEEDNAFHMYYVTQPIVKGHTVTLEGIQLGYRELKYFINSDIRPDGTARHVMGRVLEGSEWSVGYVSETDNQLNSFYYQPVLESLKELANDYGLELVFKVEISGQQITDKWVEAYNRRGPRTMKRFTHGENALSIKATIDRSGLYTALIGRGRGEEIEDSDGFGRAIQFADVEWSVANGDPIDKPLGQNYVELPEATDEFGVVMRDGSKAPAMGVFEDDQIEDSAELLQATYNELVQRSRPLVQYQSTVAKMGKAELGETVTVHRYDLDLHYETRIFKLVVDYLNPKRTEVELGDHVVESRQARESRTQRTIANLTRDQQRIREEVSYVVRTADGLNRTTYGNVEPEERRVGDYWVRDHPVHEEHTQSLIWTGDAWELLIDTSLNDEASRRVEEAISEARDAKAQVERESEERRADIQAESERLSSEWNERIEENETAVQEAKDSADTANRQITDAINEAGFSSLTDLTADLQTISTRADANALAAIDNALSASTTAESAMTLATDLSGQVSDFELTVDGFNQTVNNYTDQVAQFTSDVNGLNSTVASYETQLDEFGDTVSTYATQVSQFENTVDGLTSTVSSYRSDVEGYEAQVSEFENTVSGLNSTVSNFRSDVNGYESQVATLTNTVDGFNATVESVQADYSDLSGTVQSLGANIEVVEGQITNRVWQTDIQSAVDDIEIGGRNLLVESEFTQDMALTDSIGRPQTEPHPVPNAVLSSNIYVGSATQITISRKPGTIGSRNGLRTDHLMLVYYDENEESIRHDHFGNNNLPITVSIPEGTHYYLTSSSRQGLYDLKQEFGNIATDWTPAPEDTMELISNVETEWKQTAQGFEQSITRVESDLNGKASLTAFNTLTSTVDGTIQRIGDAEGNITQIEADIEGITNTVSDYEGRISRTEQRADGLYDVVHDPNTGLLTEVGQIAEGWQVTAQRLDDLSIGGRNLLSLRNPPLRSFVSYNTSWEVAGNTISTRINRDDRLNLTLNINVLTEIPEDDTDFTFSGYLRVNGEVPSSNPILSSLNTQQGGHHRSTKYNSDTGYIEVVASRTSSWLIHAHTNMKTNDVLEIIKPKVERGNIATDWTPAPEDMATQADITVLYNAIDLAVEEGDVIGRLNIQAGHTLIQNGEILMDADTVRFTGSAFIPNAAIEELHADKITGTQGEFSELFSKLFEAEQVTADHIDVDTQFVDMLFGVSGFFERLVADAAFVEEFQASSIEIDGGRVHGTLNGNSLDFVNIDVNSLSGNLSEFVRTQWNNAAGGNTSIDGNGITTTQDDYSMRFGSGLITAESGSSFLEISPLAIYGSANAGRWEVSAAGLVFRDNSVSGVTLASNGTSYHYRNSNIATLVAAPFVNDANSIGLAIETHSGGRMAEIGQNFNILGHLNMRGNYIERVNRVSLEQANGGYLIGDNSNSVALLNSSGNTIKFGIGSPSSWNARMEIGGNVNYYTNLNMQGNNVSNVGNLSYNSDERLKEVVSKYEGSSLEKIKTLEFVNYYWLDRDYNDELQMGLLAQQSDCISIYDEEGDRWNIDVNKQLMLVTHGLQELTVMEENTNKIASKNYLKIEELTEWKDEKDKKIEELEARIKELEGAA